MWLALCLGASGFSLLGLAECMKRCRYRLYDTLPLETEEHRPQRLAGDVAEPRALVGAHGHVAGAPPQPHLVEEILLPHETQ